MASLTKVEVLSNTGNLTKFSVFGVEVIKKPAEKTNGSKNPKGSSSK